MKNPNKLRVAVTSLAAVFALGGTACASHTGQEGSVETQGGCMPSEQVFTMTHSGQSVKYGVNDLSHDAKLSNRVYPEDYISVTAEGPGKEVTEIVFSSGNETKGSEIKVYGDQGSGVAFYQDWKTNRVDLSAIDDKDGDPYEFAIREADREVKVRVEALTAGGNAEAKVTFGQDCGSLNSVN